jgi:ribosomal protein L37AE/L43A
MRNRRDEYKLAIDRVREEHADRSGQTRVKVECPRCRTKQEIVDAPGMRKCLKCGFEFRAGLRA